MQNIGYTLADCKKKHSIPIFPWTCIARRVLTLVYWISGFRMGGGNCAMLTVYQELSRDWCLPVIYLRLTKRVNENYVSQCRSQSHGEGYSLHWTGTGFRNLWMEWEGGGVGRGGVRLTMKCSLLIQPRAFSTVLVANQFDRCKFEVIFGNPRVILIDSFLLGRKLADSNPWFAMMIWSIMSEFSRGHAKKKEVRMYMPPSAKIGK